MIVSSYRRSRRLWWLVVVSCVMTGFTVGLATASETLARVPPALFENKGLAIVNRGVLLARDGELLLEGPHFLIRRLWASSSFQGDFSSSASATAVLLEDVHLSEEPHFAASVLPHRLSAIAQPPRLSGGGCTWWEPSGDFVVVQDELVAAGQCQEVQEHPVREPLFIRSLRGGRWKVLRWLAGVSAPAFASEGALLAVGARRSDRRVTVSILDLSTGVARARFETPLGDLAFASRQRLVLEIPERVTSTDRRQPVSLRLYSARGDYLRNLGNVAEPLISHMHIAAYENGTLSVRAAAGGPPRPVVGFYPPARGLEAFAFRWPHLVVSETTAKRLLPSEVGCWSGSYAPSSEPFLATFDLGRIEPFDAPPAIVDVEPSAPLTNCGAAPPRLTALDGAELGRVAI
jgi:hypothetical protein